MTKILTNNQLKQIANNPMVALTIIRYLLESKSSVAKVKKLATEDVAEDRCCNDQILSAEIGTRPHNIYHLLRALEWMQCLMESRHFLAWG
jgi:hypothetical protein